MKKMIFLSALFLSFNVAAFDESIAEGAMSSVQNLLRNSGDRQAALKTVPAKAADKRAEIVVMGDPAAKNEIYNIAADLMPWLVEQTQGDASKMMLLIQEAQRNPNAFLQKLPSSEREKIRNLSIFVERKKESRQPASVSP